MSFDVNDDAFDRQIRDFLGWRTATGPRERGATRTLTAITDRLERPRTTAPRVSARRALAALAVVVVAVVAGGLLLPRLPSILPAGSASPTPTVTPSPTLRATLDATPAPTQTALAVASDAPCAVENAPVLSAGKLGATQDTSLWPVNLSGNMGSGGVGFGLAAYPSSNGYRTIWYATGDLSQPRLLASLQQNSTNDAFMPAVRSISANGAALLATVDQVYPEVAAPCSAWYRVDTAIGGTVTPLMPSSGIVHAAALSPNGQLAAVVWSQALTPSESYLEVFAPDGTSISSTSVPETRGAQIAWSHDSQQVAVAARGWVGVRSASESGFAATWDLTAESAPEAAPASLVWAKVNEIDYARVLPYELGSPEVNGQATYAIVVQALDPSNEQTSSVSLGATTDPWTHVLLSPDGGDVYANRDTDGGPATTGTAWEKNAPYPMQVTSGFEGTFSPVIPQWQANGAIEFAGADGPTARINRNAVDGGSTTPLAEMVPTFGGDAQGLVERLAWVSRY